MNNIKITTQNLIGDLNHKGFLELQSAYGIAQRGGSIISGYTTDHAKRLVNDVNLLNNSEKRQLIFNETIYGN